MKVVRNLCLTYLVATLALLCGCAQPQTTSQQEQPLEWYINYSWFTVQWGSDHVSRALTERTGVEVEFSTPTGEANDTLDAMIAQQTLPDLITVGWWTPQINTLIESGLVYPLNELADQYQPDFYENADSEQLQWYRQQDGNIYCYPNYSVSPQAYESGAQPPSNEVFVVRKDLYEALGCPDMSTPQGFSDALRAAASQFSEINGQPIIPLGAEEFKEEGSASFSECLRDFLAIPQEKDGQAWDYTTDPEYLIWIDTFRQLVADGVITSDLFLDKRQQISENILNGQYFCLFYQSSDMELEQKTLYEQSPERVYIAVDGPRNSSQQPPTLSGVGMNGWTVTFISKNCENPQAAIRLMSDMLSDEGQLLTQMGLEGEDYLWNGSLAIPTGRAAELFEQDYAAYVSEIGANSIYWMLQKDPGQTGWTVPQDPAMQQMQEWAKPFTVDVTAYEVIFAPGSRPASIDRQIKQLWGEVQPQLLLAETHEEFEQVLKEYIQQREQLGWSELQQVRTQMFRNNQHRLQALVP